MSKAKGNAFESRVWRDLRKIFKYSHRTIGSGVVKEDKGDINFREYLVECKHYKKITQTMIDNWWDKIVEESEKEDKQPLLIYKENYHPIRVMFILKGLRVSAVYEEWLVYIENEFKTTKVV
jgi:hypothetical protein